MVAFFYIPFFFVFFLFFFILTFAQMEGQVSSSFGGEEC